MQSFVPVSSTGHPSGELTATEGNTIKHSKKSKKHSKNNGTDGGRPKNKRHKKSHTESSSDVVAPIRLSSSERPCEPLKSDIEKLTDSTAKKRKKRFKDQSDPKHKKSERKPADEATSKQVPTTQHDATGNLCLSSGHISGGSKRESFPEGFQLQSLTTRESRDNLMVPISPEAATHSRSGSSAAYNSPARSSKSRYSSLGSRSSYERTSNPIHERYRDSDSRGADRRGRFHDSRHRRDSYYDQPRRTYVGYRRPSRSRDSSPNTYYSEQSSHRYQRHRRESPRSGYGSRIYSSDSYRHSRRFRRRSRSRSDTYRRRTPERSHSRSPSTRHDRRPPDERSRFDRESHNSAVKHSKSRSSREPELGDYYHSSREGEPTNHRKHRSPNESRSVRSSSRKDELQHRFSAKLSSKRSERYGMDSRSENRHIHRSGSRSPTHSKQHFRSDGRVSRKPHVATASDISRTAENRKKLEAPHDNTPRSRSPKPLLDERTRKRIDSSKVDAILELLDEVNTESISDTELESMLPPEVFTKAFAEQATYARNKGPASLLSNSNKVSKDDTAESAINEPKSSNLLSIDNLSSKIRQQLSGPELWDCVESIHLPDQEDLEDPKLTQSLVNLASIRKPSSQPKMSLSTLVAQWQELLDSANRDCTPDNTPSTDFITPSVPVANIMDFGTCSNKLIPIQIRAVGAAVIRHIGVSRRYIGPELLECLQNELSGQSASNQSHEAQDLSSPETQSTLPITEITWMQRNPHRSTLDALTAFESWAPIVKSSGALSSLSDQLLRQCLLGVTF